MKGSDGILGTVLRPQLLCRPAMQPPVSFQQPWGATGVGAILGRLGGRGCIVRAQLGRPGFALGEGGREGSLGCARPVVPPPPPRRMRSEPWGRTWRASAGTSAAKPPTWARARPASRLRCPSRPPGWPWPPTPCRASARASGQSGLGWERPLALAMPRLGGG